MDYTTTALVKAVQRKANLPLQGSRYTASDIVEFLNEEIQMVMTPLINKVNQEYFVTYQDFPIVDGVASYEIPSRAIAGTLREVSFLNSNGQEYNAPLFMQEQVYDTNVISAPGVLLRNNALIIYPEINSQFEYTTLRMYYYQRPGNLTLTSNGAKVLNIDVPTNVVTVNVVPETWTTDTILDIVQSKPHFNLIFKDITATAIAGVQVTLDDITGISVGDYLTEQHMAVVPQLPVEGHRIVELSATIQILMAKGDENQTETFITKYIEAKELFESLIAPRLFGENIRPQGLAGLRNFTSGNNFTPR